MYIDAASRRHQTTEFQAFTAGVAKVTAFGVITPLRMLVYVFRFHNSGRAKSLKPSCIILVGSPLDAQFLL